MIVDPNRLQTLTEISQAVSATLDLTRLYETIYRRVAAIMDADHFFIALHRSDSQVLDLVYLVEPHGHWENEEHIFGDNVTSLVIRQNRPLMLRSETDYQRFVQANGLPEVLVGQDPSEAKIFVPLSTGRRTIGTLSVQSMRPDAYTEDDTRTLSIIGAQAAVAIENARLYQRSRELAERGETLLEIGRSLTGSLELPAVLDGILGGIHRVMPYHFAAILLADGDREHLTVGGIICDESVREHADYARHNMRIPAGNGIIGRVFSSGRPLVVPDVQNCPFYADYGMPEIRSEMAVPLRRGDQIVGVLDIERTAVNAFSPDDLELLTLFASQAAVAIENARLYGAQARRVYELQAIQSLVHGLTPLHNKRRIASLVSGEMGHLIEYHTCRIFTLDAMGQELVPLDTQGFYPKDERIPLGTGITGWIAMHGEAVLVPNSDLDERVVQIEGEEPTTESVIGVPLCHRGAVQGVITLSKLGVGQFDENELRLLEIVAAQTAIAFDRADLYAALRADAITDDLTKLHNRRYLSERLREEQSRAARTGRPLAVILFDIDNFKRVNDTLGHDAGDAVLRRIGQRSKLMVRAEDLVARFGGEEFSVLLPETDGVEAMMIAERLRRAVEESAGAGGITASVGVALFRIEDLETEVLKRADVAMYHVKRGGGNRCLLYSPEACSLTGPN
ncbi:MAG: GAF domain-containing protein [Chloroflexota bacterium]